MLPTLAAIGAFISMGVANFVGPFAARRTPVFTVIAVGQILPAILLGLALVAFALPMPDPGFLAVAALSGVMIAAGTICIFRAGEIGNIGLVAVIVALSAAIPAVGGVLDGERLPIHQWLGIALAAGGTALTLLTGDQIRRGAREDDHKAIHVTGGMPVGAAAVMVEPESPVVLNALKRAGGNWVLLAGLGSAIIGFFLLVFAGLSEEGLVWATFVNRTVMAVFVAAIIVLLRQPLFAPGGIRKQIAPLPFLGIFMTLPIMLFGYASITMLTVSSALTAFAPVVTVSLSWMILREHLARPQMLGIAITVCGLVLIAI